MAIDTTAIANAVLDAYERRLVRLVFANRFLFDFPSSPYAEEGLADGPEADVPRGLLPVKPPTGGKSNKLIALASTTQAATELTEYGAPGVAGSDTIINPEPGTISAIIPVNVTGFALDDADGEEDMIGIVERGFSTAFKALGDYINNVLMGTSVKGLFGAIDSTTAYGGINRGTYTAWASHENTSGGLLSEAILEDIYYAVTGGDRRANPERLLWAFPTNQIKRYAQMARATSNNAAVVKMVMADGRQVDLGASGYSYMGRPIKDFPDAPTTQIALIETSEIHIQEKRSLTVEPKPYSADGNLWHVTWRGRLMLPNPHQCGSASGLTA
jgi:hypothetical protein